MYLVYILHVWIMRCLDVYCVVSAFCEIMQSSWNWVSMHRSTWKPWISTLNHCGYCSLHSALIRPHLDIVSSLVPQHSKSSKNRSFGALALWGWAGRATLNHSGEWMASGAPNRPPGTYMGLLSSAWWEDKSQWPQVETREFQTGYKVKNFPSRTSRSGASCLWGCRVSHSLEVFETWLDKVLGNQFWPQIWPCLVQEVGLEI